MALLTIDTLTGVNNIPSFLPSGTTMLFKQTAAPTSWTKLTTHNNKALRVVSGTATPGGTNPFTTDFTTEIGGSASPTGSTSLSITQMGPHNHGSRSTRYYGPPTAPQAHGPGPGPFAIDRGPSWNGGYVSDSGSGGSHQHSTSSGTIDFDLAYCDIILCSKD